LGLTEELTFNIGFTDGGFAGIEVLLHGEKEIDALLFERLNFEERRIANPGWAISQNLGFHQTRSTHLLRPLSKDFIIATTMMQEATREFTFTSLASSFNLYSKVLALLLASPMKNLEDLRRSTPAWPRDAASISEGAPSPTRAGGTIPASSGRR
jgi:hypothetical protein